MSMYDYRTPYDMVSDFAWVLCLFEIMDGRTPCRSRWTQLFTSRWAYDTDGRRLP